MSTVRIGTFNVENLFMRYKLLDKERGSMNPKPIDKTKFLKDGGPILFFRKQLDSFGPISKSLREATAKVLLENMPDVVAVQEIEGLEALKLFNRFYLKGEYPYAMLIDANDPREIDVGVLSRHPIVHARSYQHLRDGNTSVFSRDCLEVDVILAGEPFTFFVNHFKSKIGGGEERRDNQAKAVLKIVRDRFPGLKGRFAVCGDLNEGPEADGVKRLLKAGLYNTLEEIEDPEERWTHYYKKGKSKEQLDYVILAPSLKSKVQAVHIERRGLGTDISIYDGRRFALITGAEGASDHCAVFVDLNL